MPTKYAFPVMLSEELRMASLKDYDLKVWHPCLQMEVVAWRGLEWRWESVWVGCPRVRTLIPHLLVPDSLVASDCYATAAHQASMYWPVREPRGRTAHMRVADLNSFTASKEEYDVTSYFLWRERYIMHVRENNTRKTEETESVLSGLTRARVCVNLCV